MKEMLKTYIKNDINILDSNASLDLKERRKLKENIYKLINLSKRIDNIFESDLAFSELINKHNKNKKEDLKKFLYSLSPYSFEILITKLFNAIGYKTEITKKSNDLGIDIIAIGVMGITSIKEVIQVKRQKNNIHRPVLDKLRGVMPLHNATMGTIVTLGYFSNSCYNLAPENINLINGDELIDLLFKYRVGFNASAIEISKIDYEFFNNLSI